MFMQNGEYIAFWYLQRLCYLTQLQFTISQSEFVESLVFSGITAEFGRTERSASFVSVRLRLKSAYHLLIIVSDGAEPQQHLSSYYFAWTVFFPSESNALSTHEIQIFPLFWKFTTVKVKSKVSDLNQRWPEEFLLNSYYTEV